MKTPILVDADNLIKRCVMATAKADLKSGVILTGGAYASLTSLTRFLSVLEPPFGPVYAFFDCGVPAFRSKLLPDYKAERKERKKLLTDEEKEKAFAQMHLTRKLWETLGVHCLAYKDREADDCIAAAAVIFAKQGVTSLVLSTDKDLYQTVGLGARVYHPMREFWITPDNFEEVTQVPLRHYVLYRALVGDASDGIKGAKGVGDVTARKLLSERAVSLDASTPAEQLAQLAVSLEERKSRSKAEQGILGDQQRLQDVIAAIDLSGSFGPLKSLSVRLAAGNGGVRVREFLTQAKKLQFGSVMGDPQRFLAPFQAACSAPAPYRGWFCHSCKVEVPDQDRCRICGKTRREKA